MNNPGKLDRKITIRAATNTRGAAGGAVTAYTDLATVAAEIVSIGGREFRASGALRAEATIAFRIRYRAGMTTHHRITYEGASYDILQINEEGRRDTLLIQAQTTEGAP